MSVPATIGSVGLGAMGRPMASRLLGAGHRVIGFDRDPARAEGLPEIAPDVAALARACDVLLLSLPASDAVEETMAQVLEHGARPGEPGLLVIDTSTADPRSTRAIQARAAAVGIGFVDAPVSGGAAGATDGRLLVMTGGAPGDLVRAEPVLAPLARLVVPCGGPGAGNAAKLVNNLLCAAHLILAGEALRLGEAAGIASEALVRVLQAGSGRSAAIETNLPNWVLSGTYDSGFSLGLMAKDVRLASALGEALDALGPLGEGTAGAVGEALARFGASADFNRLVDAARPDERGG